MRSWWIVVALLLAGCTGPDAASPPGPSLLPPSLLVDRSMQDTLQLFVHATQGNVRYAFVNLTVDGTRVASREATYGLEEVLEVAEARVEVEVVDAGVPYAWTAELALNLSSDVPALRVRPNDDVGERDTGREVGLPYETLLPKRPRDGDRDASDTMEG